LFPEIKEVIQNVSVVYLD